MAQERRTTLCPLERESITYFPLMLRRVLVLRNLRLLISAIVNIDFCLKTFQQICEQLLPCTEDVLWSSKQSRFPLIFCYGVSRAIAIDLSLEVHATIRNMSGRES